jgi:RNA polymerase sigma factor (sigma-70 family)
MENQASTDPYIAAILNNEPQVLKEMYQQFFPMIQKLITDHGGTPEDARDMFQEGVMVIFEKAKEPSFQLRSKFSTYLYGVCRFLWFNRRQKKSFQEVTIPEDATSIKDDFAEIDFEARERRSIYEKAFLQLQEDCQKLLQLFFQKVSMDQIAEAMGYGSVGYARRRKFQCKEKLVALVKAQPGYSELANN